MTAIDDLAQAAGNTIDPIAAAEQLAAMLDLPSVGVHITGARVVGQGSRASAQITLSNGEVLEFDSLFMMCRPQNLIAEVAACTGATPTLKQPQAVRAVALVRALAEHTAGITDDDIARTWGLEYVQAADPIDIDMGDQAARWGAFKHLERVHPYTKAREDGTTLAAAGTLLRHTDQSRYIRTGWFRDYVRAEQDHTIAPAQIHTRMQRVGWQLRGSSGRTKATCPGTPGQLVWAFYVVPAGWETTEAGARG